jgi:hypothetical protein
MLVFFNSYAPSSKSQIESRNYALKTKGVTLELKTVPKSAPNRSRELEKHRWRNIKSFAQFLDVGFVEITLLMQDFGYDAFRANPGRLTGEEIPVGSRIVSVIDAFDAMVSSRPYREGLPFEEAERRLLEASGTQFDPAVVKCFLPLARAEMPAVLAAVGQRA